MDYERRLCKDCNGSGHIKVLVKEDSTLLFKIPFTKKALYHRYSMENIEHCKSCKGTGVH